MNIFCLNYIKKRTNKTQYVKMSEAFCKIYLHHQALYKENNATKLRIKKRSRIKN